MKISWKFTYQWKGKKTTQGIGTSKHKVYVTFSKPHEMLGKLYLSPLHWAVANDGATNEKEVVKNSWRMFAKKGLLGLGKSRPANITTWDKRKLHYYPAGAKPKERCGDPEYALTNPRGYGQCDNFAQLFEETLLVNNILPTMIEVGTNPALGKQYYVDQELEP